MSATRVVVVAAAFLVLSGCSGLAGAPTADGTPTTPTETATHPVQSALVEAGSDDYPHEIYVENDLADPVTITVAVERNGTGIFQNETTVPAETDAVVAGFTRTTLPDGDRTVTVSATDHRGATESVQVAIDPCLGDVLFFYEDDGTFEGTYSIC